MYHRTGVIALPAVIEGTVLNEYIAHPCELSISADCIQCCTFWTHSPRKFYGCQYGSLAGMQRLSKEVRWCIRSMEVVGSLSKFLVCLKLLHCIAGQAKSRAVHRGLHLRLRQSLCKVVDWIHNQGGCLCASDILQIRVCPGHHEFHLIL